MNRWIATFFILCLVPASAFAASLSERASAIDRPRVGPEVEVGAELEVGRATFGVGPNTSARLLLAGEEPVGVLLGGSVAVRYVVEDRFSIPVAQRNLGESPLSGKVTGGKLVIETSAKGVAVWSWAIAGRLAAGLDDAGAGGDAGSGDGNGGDGGGGDGATASARSLPDGLAGILENALFTPPSNDLLHDRGLGGDPAMAYVLVNGGDEDLLLRVDPRREGTEGLYGISSLSVSRYVDLYRGARTAFTLAVQPIGRPWWEAVPPPARLVHGSLKVVNTGGSRVEVTSRSTVRAETSGLSLWRVTLADAIWDGERFHPVLVGSVKVNGEAAGWLHRGDELLVDLGRPLAKGSTAEIEVIHAGELAQRPGNDSYWSLATWPWRPKSAWDAEIATWEIEVKVPEPFIPFASGVTVERSAADGVNTLRTRVDRPSQFPVVAAGKYHRFADESDGVTCNVASYVFGKEKPAQVLQGLFFSAADIFESFFGVPYPFSEVDVVEINDWGWGQAPPGVIFITQEAYNPLASTTSRIYSSGVNARFVHEVAHAWWGHVIKMGSPTEQWLTESFAEYSAALAMQAMQPGKRGEREFAGIVRGWKRNADDLGAGGSIYLANHLEARDFTTSAAEDPRRLLYNKGPLVLHALRQELGRQLGSAAQGDRYFQALLRTFVTNFDNQLGETRHLVGILNQMTGRDWQPWFERYVYGTETPPVELP